MTRTEREIDLPREDRTRLIADVVTSKLDMRAAARLPDEADALAQGNEEAEAADLDASDEEAEA